LFLANALNQSAFGTLIQAVGIGLLALLCFFLGRSTPRRHLSYWAWGWASLSLALLALYGAFLLPELRASLESIYCLGEYVFVVLLVGGLRSYSSGRALPRRSLLLLLPGLLLALLLPRLSSVFSVRFIPQALVLALGFGAALLEVERARRWRGTSPGLSVTTVALVLLTLDFAHYVPTLLWVHLSHQDMPLVYSAYTPIYDLMFEVLLGFGMVTLVLEEARREVESAHRELLAAQQKLEQAARVDSLTEALNRHAFYSLIEDRRSERPATGTVAIVDLDDLKPINDGHGHPAGDAAIRQVAKAIRAVVRPDDLVFRWGGDEFLVLLPGVAEAEAARRLARLEDGLRGVALPGVPASLDLRVSHGVAGFSTALGLEAAIAVADSAMYASKRARKGPAARSAAGLGG
jgi:diguanylate cyclase (GGDEF)-like protein